MTAQKPLYLDKETFRFLLERQGPSLGLWRAAEIAALREISYDYPVLDLGCGDGLVTSQVLSYVDVGLDPDQQALSLAAQRGIYGRFEAVPAEDMQLPAASMGTVLSNSVLEHIPNLDPVLEAVARVLRPGGKLVFTLPSETFSSWLLLPSRHYAAWRNRQLCHLNLWPIAQWAQRLERGGLEVVEVRPYLRHSLVGIWDALELLQQIWIGRRRAMSIIWQRLSPSTMDQLAQWASQLDLSASTHSGGLLIVARKKG